MPVPRLQRGKGRDPAEGVRVPERELARGKCIPPEDLPRVVAQQGVAAEDQLIRAAPRWPHNHGQNRDQAAIDPHPWTSRRKKAPACGLPGKVQLSPNSPRALENDPGFWL